MSPPQAEGLTLDLARQVLEAQPFSVLLGARLTGFGGGRILRAHATTVHAGRRQATCRCELYTLGGAEAGDGSATDGTLTHCATAQGTIVSLASA